MTQRPWRVHSCAHRMASACNVCILAAVFWYSAGARGATTDATPSMFLFSGFGTFGLVHSSDDRADFKGSLFKANGAGFTRAWSPDVDSKFGAQIIAKLTPTLSAMLQAISEQRPNKTYSPHVEWANIKYQPVPEFSIRIGRIVLPTFLVSDSLKVGFSIPWVRPPIEVYNLVPVTSHDGVDATYTVRLGKVVNTLIGTYGVNDADDPRGGKSKTRRQMSISDTAEFGVATLHVTYQQAHLTIDSLNNFIDGFRQFGPQGSAIADKYDEHAKRISFVGLGASYDPGKWFVTGEWGVSEFDSVLGKRSGWYVSGGYRWEGLTPYLTYAQIKGESRTSDPGLTVSALPPALVGAAISFNGGLNAILGAIPVQKTVSVGARWDFTKSVDVKMQYDRIRLGAGSPGTLDNTQPDFAPGGTVNLFSLAIDFVF